MFAILTFVLHAWWSIGLVAILLLAGAVAAYIGGFHRLAVLLAVGAVAQVYSGYIFQQGEAECRATVQREVAAEQDRQRTVGEAATAALTHELEAAAALNQIADDRVAAYERELALRAPNNACILNDRDAAAINGTGG